MAAHVPLKIEFMEDERYHDLVMRLKYFPSEQSYREKLQVMENFVDQNQS